jgi:predicted CXXCH cytochrome family protein
MRHILKIVVLLLVAAGSLHAQTKLAIVNSKHDFRATSSATIRSTSQQDACIFCHTPHNSDPGPYLWNQKLSTTNFSTYTSSTLQSNVAPIQSQDVSKLCLSCHDGTIALGDTVNNGLVPFVQGSSYTLPLNSPANLATARGFADDHPFGFVPTLSAEIKTPAPDGPVRLDGTGKVQCTSCHDPHRENADSTVGKFLVTSNESSAICLACHTTAGWVTSNHRMPPDPGEDLKYTALQGAHTGYAGVSKNGCESCHRPHSPQTAQRLLKFQEENTCYQCHDGTVVAENLKAEIYTKPYKHPVDVTPSSHDASEKPSSALYPLPETSSGAPRHAECMDCHNAHYSNSLKAQPPQIDGPLLGVSGQSVGNSYLPQSVNEYEICFKCHADSANRPQYLDTGIVGIGYGRNPQRQFDSGNPNRSNTRIEFQFSPSYHPVTRPRDLSIGLGGEVPSLRLAPISSGGSTLPSRTLSATSYIYCTDCHNSDTGNNLGTLSGPAGPHASNFPHLLERANTLEPPPAMAGGASPGVSYSPTNYALCDKCHDVEGSINQDRSFKQHALHVRANNTACSTCHDPHASQSPMLINFDRSIVGPSSGGRLEFQHTGFQKGNCYLSCHGKDHNPESY